MSCLCGGCQQCLYAQGFRDEDYCETCGELPGACDCEEDA